MTRIAVFPIDAVGHLNGMLAVCRVLANHSCVTAVRGFGRVELEPLFHGVGAEFTVTTRDVPDGPNGDLAWKSFIRPLSCAAQTLQALEDFAPDVVLFDPFSVLGALAARTAKVPSVSFVTMAGYGTLGDPFVLRHGWGRDDVKHANATYASQFGVDFQAEGALPVLFPAATLTIVTSLERLSLRANPVTQPLLAKLVAAGSCTAYVGHCEGTEWLTERTIRSFKAGGQTKTEAPFSFDGLVQAKQNGQRIVLFSLGTVLTDFRYASPVGGAPTGQQFLERMLQIVTEAVHGDDQFVLVAATGYRFTGHKKIQLPKGSMLYEVVPQRAILDRFSDVFITHHGANSQMESILAGVPMVSLPGVGDQIPNARVGQSMGLARSNWDLADPFSTCSADLMLDTLRDCVGDETCIRALAATRSELLAAGGAHEAARLIISTSRPLPGASPRTCALSRAHESAPRPAASRQAPEGVKETWERPGASLKDFNEIA